MWSNVRSRCQRQKYALTVLRGGKSLGKAAHWHPVLRIPRTTWQRSGRSALPQSSSSSRTAMRRSGAACTWNSHAAEAVVDHRETPGGKRQTLAVDAADVRALRGRPSGQPGFDGKAFAGRRKLALPEGVEQAARKQHALTLPPTECAPVLVREQKLLTEVLSKLRWRLERDLDAVMALTPATKDGKRLRRRYGKVRSHLFTFLDIRKSGRITTAASGNCGHRNLPKSHRRILLRRRC